MISRGFVVAAQGGSIEAALPGAALGDGVRMRTARGEVTGVVTALRNSRAIIAPHEQIDGVVAGDAANVDPAALTLPLGMTLLGRAIDSRGVALDGGRALRGRRRSLTCAAPAPAQRAVIREPFWTGIRSIDGLLTIGRGARIGLFGPAGAGKSTLLHMLVRGARADAVVIGLVGERGREAQEWMRARPAHATLVCATSDRSACERVHAARVAIAQAGCLRSRGLHVLLILDSLARYAAALRELGVAAGEGVGRGGYPPGVFAQLAQFLEIAGAAGRGSITLVATVLSDGDERDPVSESARSLLDGHLQLSAQLAQAGRFPAIDVPASTSRTMHDVVDATHAANALAVRHAVAELAKSEDARALGIMPAQPDALAAIAAQDAIEAFLRQSGPSEQPASTLSALAAVADRLR